MQSNHIPACFSKIQSSVPKTRWQQRQKKNPARSLSSLTMNWTLIEIIVDSRIIAQ